MPLRRRFAPLLAPLLLAAPLAAQTPTVGPPRGAVVVVGGGAIGTDVYGRFIELAGGPDALIVDVPTAGGDSTYPATWRGTAGLKAAGARNVVVLHTIDRTQADDSAFAAVLARAGGVWFEGGRQWHLVDSYAGTRTERGFHDVLARGGVVGGTSAGASILASYLLRGARAGNTIVMAPGYEQGFGFLRGVAIDQHVVARERLRDLADSLRPAHPELLGISEDEGTAWVVRGDVAEIVGRNKAFVYGGRDANDAGSPFLTLHPGDRYDLAARRVVHRAIDDSPLTESFVDSLFRGARGGAGATATRRVAVLVAQSGRVLVDKSYGIALSSNYMPTTTVPNFPLGGLARVLDSLAARLGPRGTGDAQLVSRRIFTPIGAHKTVVESGRAESNVDELYRLALGFEAAGRTFFADSLGAPLGAPPADEALGWTADRWRGLARLGVYGTDAGTRHAFVRLPDRHVTIIILSDDDALDAKGIAERIGDRLLGAAKR